MAATAPRTRTGCTSCRVRHLKCDETRPVCRRCQRAGRECVRGYNVRFRYGTGIGPRVGAGGVLGAGSRAEYWFDEDQVWIETGGRLNFVDETTSLTNATWEPSPSPSPPPSSVGLPVESIPQQPPATFPPSPFSTSSTSHLNSAPNLSPKSPQKHLSLASEFSIDGRILISPESQEGSVEDVGMEYGIDAVGVEGVACLLGDIPGDEDENGYIATEEELGGTGLHGSIDEEILHLEPPYGLWALKSERDAHLLKHFVQNLGSWFDVCDYQKHFTTLVPQHALTSPMLLNAILALSARQLSRTMFYDPLLANHYHQECLKHYIPLLSSASSLLDERLMAATVVLRLFEEIDVPTTGTDALNHLLGTSIFVNTHSSIATSGGLRQASFWVYLRQDIYIAFTQQRSIKTNLENCQVDRSFEPADDCTWANRIIRICAEILIFAFGGEKGGREKWEELVRLVETWREKRPRSFNAVWKEKGGWEGEWFLADPHVCGAQYWHLAKLLLAVYNPSLPRLGPAVKAASKELEREVLANLVMRFTFVGSTGGGWFTDREEQERLLEVLKFTEKEYAWPTSMTQSTLKELWGWEEEWV